jgi:hypothetical protein
MKGFISVIPCELEIIRYSLLCFYDDNKIYFGFTSFVPLSCCCSNVIYHLLVLKKKNLSGRQILYYIGEIRFLCLHEDI